jgi:hypothetical protein
MLGKLEALLYFSARAETLRTDLGSRKGSEQSRIERQILAFFWS